MDYVIKEEGRDEIVNTTIPDQAQQQSRLEEFSRLLKQKSDKKGEN